MRTGVRIFRLLIAMGGAATTAHAAEVRLFAAASLAEAVQEIVPRFTASTGHAVQMNFGGSGVLARQIREGAPADVFFSADELRVDELARDHLVLEETRRTLLSNQLVLIVPQGGESAIASFSDLRRREVRRIAIGEPAIVPAGAYARQHLQALGVWNDVARKFVPLDNVRAVLAAVAGANADAGIVYRTDVRDERRVRIVSTVPADDGPRIAYPAVVLRQAADPEAARALLDYLGGEAAQAVFVRHGFLPARR